MLYDLKPIVVNNVFTDEEYLSIYSEINYKNINSVLNFNNINNLYFNKVTDFGYISTGIDNSKIINKIKNIAEKIFNVKLNEPMIHFARYTNYSGASPELAPHVDVFLENPSYTLSIQLDTTKPEWIIRVDDYFFTLEKNSLLGFSGTHQIHSRDLLNFNDEDYCDILVCQFKDLNFMQTDSLKNNEEHKQKIDIKFKDHIKKYRV